MKKKSNDDENNQDDGDELRILSSDDEKIKVVGEVLANESSRTIMRVLSGNKEMTINEISQEIDLSIPLVSHHLKKMQQTGVVKISRVGTSVKGHKMNYYSATNQSILITPPERKVHSMFHSLRKFSKFAAIGLAGLVSWSIVKPNDGAPLQSIPSRGEFSDDAVVSTDEKWDSAYQSELDVDTSMSLEVEESAEKSLAEPVSSPPVPESQLPLESTSESDSQSAPAPEPEPSHSGIQDFASELADSERTNTGSISLDRTVYPEPFASTSSSAIGVDAIDPLIFSIIIPIAVIAGGIILERILSRWYRKKQLKQSSPSQ